MIACVSGGGIVSASKGLAKELQSRAENGEGMLFVVGFSAGFSRLCHQTSHTRKNNSASYTGQKADGSELGRKEAADPGGGSGQVQNPSPISDLALVSD